MTDDPRIRVRRFLDEVFNKRNLDAVDDWIAPGYISHNGVFPGASGPEGVRNAARQQHEAFPDLHTEVEDVAVDGDNVVLRARDRFTHNGEFLGFPPTGKTIEVTWIDWFKLRDGKAVEAWLEIDMKRLEAQLRGDI